MAVRQCKGCGGTEFEKRGTRRTYHPLDDDLNDDTWHEGDVELDTNDDGSDAIYCRACGDMIGGL